MTSEEEKIYQAAFKDGRNLGKKIPEGVEPEYARGFIAGRLSLAWDKQVEDRANGAE